ncbi:MAG: cob(I)yrinic acid a,c-diamide adenosyltransferase [Patescibacteria group bacterium]|mgnify:CR=1 FL=1
MLYTRKGDKGTTKTFGCDQRISKSSAIAEALGSLDEINSLLGLCKVKCHRGSNQGLSLKTQTQGLSLVSVSLLNDVQQTLFIIQAELAGAPKTVAKEKVKAVEKVIDKIEKKLPPTKTFFISGGTELATLFDYARTVARRAERRAWQAEEEAKAAGAKSLLGQHSFAYLNRLSSLLYALARLANHESGITEESPSYK